MSRRRKKAPCYVPGCSAAGQPFWCGEHYRLLSRATKAALSEAARRGAYELHRKGDDGQSLMDKAKAEIQKRVDAGVRPGAWRGPARPAPKFLGNGRGDE